MKCCVLNRPVATLAVVLLVAHTACAVDTVELVTGAVARGTVRSYSGEDVVIDIVIRGRRFQRRYPKNRVRSITIDGRRIDPNSSTPEGGDAAAGTERPREEVLAEIDRLGRTQPDWFESTPLDYPETLDLSWPMPAPKPWNNSKNIGQYIWDRINPNSDKWREGVRLMHHILSQNRDKDVQQRAMRSLGAMYHNLLQDHARAAFWFRQSGLEDELAQHPQPAVFLADCYFRLGSRQMAMDVLRKMPRHPYLAIKLLGDMGETELALRMAENFSRTGQASTSFLYAGDACRVAGRLQEAEQYYRKAIAAIPADEADKPHRVRDKARAEASIAAIRFYTLDPEDVADGTYTASSIGYEAQVHVKVVVASGRIESVEVTQHREKQYYSALTDTPRKIVERQSVAGIDATSSATITSEAIINATAKALADGLQ